MRVYKIIDGLAQVFSVVFNDKVVNAFQYFKNQVRWYGKKRKFRRVGNNVHLEFPAKILTPDKIEIGDNVFIAPNCVFSTAGHAIDSEQRSRGLEIALPITVGDDVWIGANVSVLPGVTIGSNTIIGAGSVVNKDIPEGVIAVGNPCKVMRKITEEDKKKYPVFEG